MLGLRVSVFALLGLLVGTPCWGESVFSFRGIGLMEEGIDARSWGMGGAHRSVADGRGFSLGNPASLARFTRAGIAAGFLGEQVTAETEGVGEGRLLGGNLRLFRFVLPLTHGTVASVGLFPYSRVAFDLAEDVADGNIVYQREIQGNGGIRLVSIALARPLGEHLLVGGEFRSFFGAAVETWTRRFEDGEWTDIRDEFTRAHRGHTWGGGVTVRYGDELSASVTYVMKATLDVTTTVETYLGSEVIPASQSEQKGECSLPAEIGFGVAWRPMPSLLLALDGKRIFGEDLSEGDRDGSQVSVGVEYTRSSRPDAPYLHRVPLRMGAKWSALPYELGVPRSGIDEHFLSVGVGLPLRGGRSVVDVALEIGQRGDLDRHGVRETIFRQVISFSGWERWFERRK